MTTIFTPTYNRAGFLMPLYDSIKKQSSRDFEWVIVDDGSTDNTYEVMADIISSHDDSFPIRYFKKPNGGKHTAINMGVNVAEGELFLILDSDDELPPTAIEMIEKRYEKIKNDESIGGVCGYMAHRNGDRIGKPVIETEASSMELRYKHNITGDMCEVFRTAVLKEYPFPEISGEKFCPEALVWNRIAQKYRLCVFPDIIYLRDYIDGGLTDNIVRIRMNSPIASMMTYAELNGYDVPLKEKAKAAINYWRFRLCCGWDGKKISPRIEGLWNALAPMGLLMHLKDLKHDNNYL